MTISNIKQSISSRTLERGPANASDSGTNGISNSSDFVSTLTNDGSGVHDISVPNGLDGFNNSNESQYDIYDAEAQHTRTRSYHQRLRDRSLGPSVA